MNRSLFGPFLLAVVLIGFSPFNSTAQTVPDSMNGLPLVFEEDFESGMDRWETTDDGAWDVVNENGNHVLALERQSSYEPPVRSPHNMALIGDLWLSDFVLEARVKSTTEDYNHRDMCIFYGWQDPAHFYYTHIALNADPHSNSIFLVNDAPRVSIANWRTDGTRWKDDTYHTVRIVRDTDMGTIKVYFDDMNQPIMVAEDKHFRMGRVGFGSFDDTGRVDDVRIWGWRAGGMLEAGD
jgi:hypothetical protein